jgi:hypothetical protein
MLQPLVLARKPHSGPTGGHPPREGPTSNGQRHGLRGGFQRPWKGDRQLRSMVRCEEPTAMRILMGGFRGTLGAQY